MLLLLGKLNENTEQQIREQLLQRLLTNPLQLSVNFSNDYRVLAFFCDICCKKFKVLSLAIILSLKILLEAD